MRQLLAALTVLLATTGLSRAYTTVSEDQLFSLIESNDSLVLVDVREESEYDPGHIDGAHLYPYTSKVLEEKYRELPAGYPIAFYCGSGSRSAKAAAFLEREDSAAYAGRIYSLDGGVAAWTYGLVTGGQDGPQIVLQPDTLDFGGNGAGTRWLTINNSASRCAALVLIPAVRTKAFTSVADTAVIMPGDSILITVSFSPAIDTLHTANLAAFHGGVARDTIVAVLTGSGPPAIKGDIDSDGEVDIGDFMALLDALSDRSDDAVTDRMDIDSDGAVDLADLMRLLLIIRGND